MSGKGKLQPKVGHVSASLMLVYKLKLDETTLLTLTNIIIIGKNASY
jgi:hypothetical protein